ncbi:MAG: hypothetical protein R3E39_07200 [Anaerolineae bacterium]
MSIVLLGTWILFCSYSLFNYYFSQTYAKSKDWPSVVQFLHRNISQGELVIQSTVDPAFGYYFHKISSQISDIALPANPTQSQQNIVKELEVVTSTAVGIWRVGHPNPEWINSNVVEAWLDSNMQLTFDGHIADIAIRQYKSWDIPASEIDSAEIARFGDIAELVDFKIFMNSHEDVTIWLYWRPLKTTTSPLKVFVHMLGSVNPATGSPIWTQDDQYPQGGHTGSDIWKIGSLYRDIYRLSLNDVPEGTYSVEIGFYDPTTNVRLPVGARDSLLLTEIMVK